MKIKSASLVLPVLAFCGAVFYLTAAAADTGKASRSPGGAPAGDPPTIRLPAAIEAAPERLLQRIQLLEQRLAAADKRIAGLEAQFGPHTHEYASFVPSGYQPYSAFLEHPERMKHLLIPYHLDPMPSFTANTKPPKR